MSLFAPVSFLGEPATHLDPHPSFLWKGAMQLATHCIDFCIRLIFAAPGTPGDPIRDFFKFLYPRGEKGGWVLRPPPSSPEGPAEPVLGPAPQAPEIFFGFFLYAPQARSQNWPGWVGPPDPPPRGTGKWVGGSAAGPPRGA